jgi:Protein of unknown function (DUF3108)
MASRYLQPVLTIRRTGSDWPRPRAARLLVRLLLATTAWTAGFALTPATALASDQQATALRPYTARYKTTARGIDLNLERQLKAGSNGRYILTNGGKIMVIGFHEVSVFTVDGDQVMPRSYVYQGTGLVNRRREVHFTANTGIIRSLYKDNWYELPYSETTLDRMSQLEQLRLSLLADTEEPPQDMILRVADGKRVKDTQLVFVAEELLQTPLGPVATLHFERLHDSQERKSDIWVAPEWDYLMVRTIHIEDGDPVEMTLTSATIDGDPVAVN